MGPILRENVFYILVITAKIWTFTWWMQWSIKICILKGTKYSIWKVLWYIYRTKQYAFAQKTINYLGEPHNNPQISGQLPAKYWLVLLRSRKKINSIWALEIEKRTEILILWQADGSAQRFSIILINICHYLPNVVVSAKVVSQYLKCLIYYVVIIHWARFKQGNLHVSHCQKCQG